MKKNMQCIQEESNNYSTVNSHYLFVYMHIPVLNKKYYRNIYKINNKGY